MEVKKAYYINKAIVYKESFARKKLNTILKQILKKIEYSYINDAVLYKYVYIYK